MRIAYVTTYDAESIEAWSGLGFFMLKTLRDCGFNTELVGNLKENYCRLSRNKHRLYNRVLHRNYLRHREPLVLRDYARQIQDTLDSSNFDVVFSPGTIPIAYLKTDKPVVFWTDATFAGLVNFYPEYSNLCRESIINGNKMEQAALRKCRFAIYSSKWAADSAINNYDVDPNKVKVVPFGANIDRHPTNDEVRQIIDARQLDVVRLLFIGVDWERKGGDTAVEVARILNNSGVQTVLHVVGCLPTTVQPEFVNLHGFISKKDEAGRNLLDHLFRTSHFLILPSRAECFGVVFAEASSYGLPCLTFNVGGTGSAVETGVNGKLFPIEAHAQDYCDYIVAQVSSKAAYSALASSAFDQYRMRLNWEVAGEEVSQLLHKAAAAPEPIDSAHEAAAVMRPQNV